MSSELENIVAALRALAKDAAQLRPFVRAAADRQHDILQELQALGARLPGAQRAMRALDASIDATNKIDPALATIDQTARPPCPTPRPSRPGQATCQVALPQIIRCGSSLTVYVAEPGKPPRYFDTYVGNGRAVTE